MALHYLGELDGDLEAAYDRWLDWSEGGTNTENNAKLCPYKWDRFLDDPNRALCTGGKIHHYATTLGGWKSTQKPEPDPVDLQAIDPTEFDGVEVSPRRWFVPGLDSNGACNRALRGGR